MAQHGYGTVDNFGQSQLLENTGIGSQWLFLCLLELDVLRKGAVMVGNSVGLVTGTFGDVDSGMGMVGSAITMELVGTGERVGSTWTSSSWG